MKLAVALAALLAVCAPSATIAAGDADKGARLHGACLQCHHTELYVPPKAKVKTFKKLQAETAKWADYYNPRFEPGEIADLVAYLNRDFYRFPEGTAK